MADHEGMVGCLEGLVVLDSFLTQVGYACPLYVRRGVVTEGSEANAASCSHDIQ